MSADTSPERSADGRRGALALGTPLLIGAVVLGACLFGIYTRPADFLATLWPANAILLAMLIRVPGAARLSGWICAAIAYMAADLMTGSSLKMTAVLTAANLFGVGVGYAVHLWHPDRIRALKEPVSVLWLAFIAAAAAASAGLFGMLANPLLFQRSIATGWSFWFATEFVNYVTILPVLLSAPPLATLAGRWKTSRLSIRGADILPVLAVIAAGGAASLIGGAGSVAFPVPALLWCAIVYPIFPTAALTLISGVWTLAAVSTGLVGSQFVPDNEVDLVSIRLGISLVALAPIMLACVMQGRNELLARLHHMAMHDPLTGARNRDSFRATAQGILDKRADVPFALMMVDLDHFKAVNDRFGHAAGDRALAWFGEHARGCLRTGDLLGRMGGEEFAILVPNCSPQHALGLAERIRNLVSTPIPLENGGFLVVTASIGLLSIPPGDGRGIDELLPVADKLLYAAKRNGRDRVETGETLPA